IVTTGAIAWPRRIAAMMMTISTLPPPAASVLIAQLTKPAANSARSIELGCIGVSVHIRDRSALILIKWIRRRRSCVRMHWRHRVIEHGHYADLRRYHEMVAAGRKAIVLIGSRETLD